MKLTKEYIEKLYREMSLTEVANHLGMARSTLYYHMKKLGVERRSKSEAQQKHLETSNHQRVGKLHSKDAKEKISSGTRRFWDSDSGSIQKTRLGDMRREEWENRSIKDRSRILQRLQTAERPVPGELSRFGKKLSEFLSQREDIRTGIQLTGGHVSDIILPTHAVVLELVIPFSTYGDEQKQKLESRYDRLVNQLNDVGYRVMIIEDKSNTVSQARCQRVYDALQAFLNNTTPHITITS